MVWLPIDAKFPIEDYQRLIDAVDPVAMAAAKAIETRLKNGPEHPRNMWHRRTPPICRPYLPIGGCTPRRCAAGTVEPAARLPRDAGRTTTLAAMLNSLQMGFRRWPSSSVRPRSGPCSGR